MLTTATDLSTTTVVKSSQLANKKAACLFGHAAFALDAFASLVCNHLSKIIYHNITPSAFYDATTREVIASNFLAVLTKSTVVSTVNRGRAFLSAWERPSSVYNSPVKPFISL